MKVLPANAVEISHNKEAFSLIFRFQSPDGQQESIYVVIAPAGAKTTADLLSKQIQEYEKEAGTITPWTTHISNSPANTDNNHLAS